MTSPQAKSRLGRPKRFSFDDIHKLVLNFFGNDVPVRIGDVASVKNSLVDESSKAYFNGERSLFLYVFRQSGANTIRVADGVLKAIEKINADLETEVGKPKLTVVRDGSIWIRANIKDVNESILIGIVLAVAARRSSLGSLCQIH